MELAKIRLSKEEAEKNGNGLVFINYTYKGIIDSEVVKSAVIDSLISPYAPFPMLLPPLITTDTIYSENTITITKKEYPKFEIITVAKLKEISDSLPGINNIQEQLKQDLNKIIQIGYEYVEMEWDYKDKKITSYCIVSGERYIYDNIASRIIEGTTTTTSETF